MARSASPQMPISPRSRYEIVDIVRGFALFGVLLANMVWTSQFFSVTDIQRAELSTADIDPSVSLIVYMLVDGKFYTLFAMLFGLGFAMQLSRANDIGRNVLPVYCRRLAILFFIGVGHALLLWFGDILHVYALVGFILILFRDKSDRFILSWAVGLALLTSLSPLIDWVTTIGNWGDSVLQDQSMASRFAALTNGNWADVVSVNWVFNRNAYLRPDLGFDSTIYWYLSVLWKFLVGFVAGRRMLLQNADENIDVFRRIFPWAATIGIIGNAYLSVSEWIYDLSISGSPSPVILLSWVLVEISMFALSMAYLSGLVILYRRPGWHDKIAVFAPVGKMALTNYLMQSFFMVFLFYGFGLSLLGNVGVSFCVVLSVILFGFQVVISRWWLTRFRFGPMEWVWRSMTYGERPTFKLDVAA
jgi:uncharacterized protein